MTEKQHSPWEVLREFVADIEAACGIGQGGELDREALTKDWPDLLATYDRALVCLKMPESPHQPNDHGLWRCRHCGDTLSTADWTYRDLAESGTPMCDTCDCDYDLVEMPIMPG